MSSSKYSIKYQNAAIMYVYKIYKNKVIKSYSNTTISKFRVQKNLSVLKAYLLQIYIYNDALIEIINIHADLISELDYEIKNIYQELNNAVINIFNVSLSITDMLKIFKKYSSDIHTLFQNIQDKITFMDIDNYFTIQFELDKEQLYSYIDNISDQINDVEEEKKDNEDDVDDDNDEEEKNEEEKNDE